jgi:predicted ATP-dependent protease
MDSLPPIPERRSDLAVDPSALRLTIDETTLGFATTREVQPPDTLVGQQRGVEALELGLALRGRGTHVFVAGPAGTGRSTAVLGLLDRIAPTRATPPDRVYVHRFDDPERPQLLTLTAGGGARFVTAMNELRKTLATRVPMLLEDRELARQREAIGKRYAAEEEHAVEALRERAEADGFGLVSVEMGPMVRPEVVPVRNGQPAPLEQLQRMLPPEAFAAVRAKLEAYNDELRELLRAARDRQRAFAGELRELVARSAELLADEEVGDVRGSVDAADAAAIDAVLHAVRADIVAGVVELAEGGAEAAGRVGARIERFRVNLVADRHDTTGAPVIVERFPSRQNLAGSVERVQDGPMSFRADATTIRGGSLLRADGGFLVVHALDVLQEPGAWDALKRSLETGLLDIGASMPGIFGLPRPLEPDPIPVDVKVVMIGERGVFDLLWHADPDFRKLFGIRADFAADMPLSDAAEERYACVVAAHCVNEQLPPADASAVAALIEDGVVRAGRRNRISARFGDLAALLREAAFIAAARGGDVISRRDVQQAQDARQRREGLIEERMQDLLQEGIVLVSTSGAAVGQVNGLSVYDLGYHAFGKPTRITASAAPGQAGIINVEREAKLSGSIYDKGVLIIAGFVRRRYAEQGPLTLTASLAFEQSYAGVDGDSASIAEVVALLSELAQLPADNAIAITGSINQHGQVQPVGGVNEKITGFHALCAARGLDATNGVVLPAQNVDDLMLPAAVCADVAAGRFHIRAVSHVDEALEIALGAPISRIDELVRKRLAVFADLLAQAPGGDRPPSGVTLSAPQTPVPSNVHR